MNQEIDVARLNDDVKFVEKNVNSNSIVQVCNLNFPINNKGGNFSFYFLYTCRM